MSDYTQQLLKENEKLREKLNILESNVRQIELSFVLSRDITFRSKEEIEWHKQKMEHYFSSEAARILGKPEFFSTREKKWIITVIRYLLELTIYFYPQVSKVLNRCKKIKFDKQNLDPYSGLTQIFSKTRVLPVSGQSKVTETEP